MRTILSLSVDVTSPKLRRSMLYQVGAQRRRFAVGLVNTHARCSNETCSEAHASSPRSVAAKSSGTRRELLFSRRRARSKYFRVVRRSACPTWSAMCSRSAPPARASVMLVARKLCALGTRTPAVCVVRLPIAARRRGRIPPFLRGAPRRGPPLLSPGRAGRAPRRSCSRTPRASRRH